MKTNKYSFSSLPLLSSGRGQNLLRTILTPLLILTALALPSPVKASCDNFIVSQALATYEATSQSVLAKQYIVYAYLTHGACNIDDNFYTNFRSVLLVAGHGFCSDQDLTCEANAFLDRYSPAVRESSALAAHFALSDPYPPAIYHFDAASNRLWPWYTSESSCPTVYYSDAVSEQRWFVIDHTRFC